MRGTVKFFNVSKGFGFLTPDDGSRDVFVHDSELKRSGVLPPKEGQIMEFETQEGPKGLSAIRIKAL